MCQTLRSLALFCVCRKLQVHLLGDTYVPVTLDLPEFMERCIGMAQSLISLQSLKTNVSCYSFAKKNETELIFKQS